MGAEGGRAGHRSVLPSDRIARASLVLMALAVAAYTATTFLRATPGFLPLADGWLQIAANTLAAAVAALRPVRSPRDRALWTAIAAALAARAVGFGLFVWVVRELDPVPYPSVADAAWLASYLALVVAVVLVARRERHRTSTTLVLDGLVTAVAVASVTVALLYPTLVTLTAERSTTVVAVNLAYPVLDVVLLVVTAGVLVSRGGRPAADLSWLAAGLIAFTVIDIVYVYQSAAGTFRPGTPLSALSVVAGGVLATAAWVPGGPGHRDSEPLPRLATPVVASLTCLAVLVAASVRELPSVAVLLATIGVLVAIGRTQFTFRLVRAAAEARLAARTDDLTGVANRRACNEALAAAAAGNDRGRGFALLVLDLDGFREVNDAHGHHLGDQLLQGVATRLASTVRDGDLLARVGGDEFAVVVHGAGAVEVAEVADRIQASLRRPFDVGARTFTVEVSLGSAICPDDATDPSELLRLADLAMYDAKTSGVGLRPYDPRRHRSGDSRRRSLEELRRAIDEDQLVVHYQPQVDLWTGRTTGLEALVRWQHPSAGLLAPGEFLPLAESGGLMRLLTLHVLEVAARRAAEWRAQGTPVTVGVNLSVSNLLDADFPAQVDLILGSVGLPGASMTLELTEDLFVADPVRAQRAISSLLERDVRLVVDDYGTGYSSLGYLRDLEGLAGLKLDRSFVRRIDTDPRSRAIVASTIGLAASLGLELTAEGVETLAVRDRLRDLGCRTAQGFLFSHPVPADRLDLLTSLPTGRPDG